jgi:hypothetical protein
VLWPFPSEMYSERKNNIGWYSPIFNPCRLTEQRAKYLIIHPKAG